MRALPSVTGRRSALAVGGLVLVLVLVVLMVLVQPRRAQERRLDAAASEAAEAFATAASGGDLRTAAVAGASPGGAQEQYAALVEGLGAEPEVDVGTVDREGDSGSAELRWTWPFGPQGWSYTTDVALVRTRDSRDAWAVQWSPRAVHPGLQDGDVLQATRTSAPRADVLGAGDVPLVTDRPVVEVGVQPSRAADPAALSRTLADLVDVDAAALEARVRAAGPDAFVPVVTLRRADYEPLRTRLQPLPGTVFRESSLPLAPSRSFARALLGSTGQVTAEVVEQSQGRLAAGDVAGLAGLART